MIVADAGYGLLLFLTALLIRAKYPHLQGQKRRWLRLSFLLSIGCIVWGVLTDSYFGLQRNPKGLGRLAPLTYLAEAKADYHLQNNDITHQTLVGKHPSLKEASQGKAILEHPDVLSSYTNDILMELSLLVGMLHISLSLLRYLKRNWAGIGWICFLIGGYLYFPYALHATSLIQFLGLVHKEVAGVIGIQMIYIGIGTAFLLALIQKKWRGIGEVMHVVQVFGDVLSYLRLYALALASTLMAETFNGLGWRLGFAVGILILLLGHAINLSLGLMGGVIHGLRLNFLEWYHYSFEGGGKLFNPLKKLKKGVS
jgi:V/A-type H+-transporting ATPase subunit I